MGETGVGCGKPVWPGGAGNGRGRGRGGPTTGVPGAGEAHGVFQGEGGAGADGSGWCGRRRRAVPGCRGARLGRDAEVRPAPAGTADERVAVEDAREEPLQQHEAVRLGRPVHAEPGDAERAGPVGEQVEQPVPAGAEALVTLVTGRQDGYVRDAVAPTEGGVLDHPRRGGIVLLQPVEKAVPVRHAPAVGRALGVALVRDGEVRAGGPASDTDDLHVHAPDSHRLRSAGYTE